MIYSTVCWLEMAPQSCKSIVDLPTPGSPLSSTTPPNTMPPPKTRSSSEMPVRMRLFSSVVLMSARRLAVSEVTPSCRTGAAALPPESPALGASATTSSFMVFQLPQLGQRPIQRGLVSPQLEQTYTVFSFGSFILDSLFSFHENHFLYHTTSGPRPQESRALIWPASDDLQDIQGRWPHRRAGRDRPPVRRIAPPGAVLLPDGFPYPLYRKRTHGFGC